jgi:hypothetical protein
MCWQVPGDAEVFPKPLVEKLLAGVDLVRSYPFGAYLASIA